MTARQSQITVIPAQAGIRLSACGILACLALSFPFSAHAQIKSACEYLTEYAGLAYQPGVDVNGNPVVPADLYSAPSPFVPNVIEIPVTVDVLRRYGLDSDPLYQGMEMNAYMGVMAIHKNGQVLYNGRDITAPVMERCKKEQPDYDRALSAPPVQLAPENR